MSLIWTTIKGAATGSTGAELGNTMMASAVGAGVNLLRSKLAGGNPTGVKFYYDAKAGGKIVNVIARKAAGAAAAMAKEKAEGALKKLLGGKKLDPGQTAASWLADQAAKAGREQVSYGFLHDVYSYDDFGNICYDSVMLGIPVSPPVAVSVSRYGGKSIKSFSNDWLVWYDTTGLVNISSDKNLVITQVTGRDYSRKELVSNGDLHFSVSGHITSRIPDIYPSDEVRKFLQIMRYKGIVDVNNEVFAQLNINKVVIQSFSLPSSEGNKAVQDYSFECIAIQPDSEVVVSDDTIKVYDEELNTSDNASANKELTWKDVLNGQLEGLKTQAADTASQGLGLATGMLDGVL